MATEKTSATFVFGYEDTDETRTYKFDDVPGSALDNLVTNVKAINASLAAGTDGGLSAFFLADSGAHFTGIIAAYSDETEEESINLNS